MRPRPGGHSSGGFVSRPRLSPTVGKRFYRQTAKMTGSYSTSRVPARTCSGFSEGIGVAGIPFAGGPPFRPLLAEGGQTDSPLFRTDGPVN
jgi:hypothetical protein